MNVPTVNKPRARRFIVLNYRICVLIHLNSECSCNVRYKTWRRSVRKYEKADVNRVILRPRPHDVCEARRDTTPLFIMRCCMPQTKYVSVQNRRKQIQEPTSSLM